MVLYSKVKRGFCSVVLCALLGVFLVVSGCGENLFKGLSVQESGTDLTSLNDQLGVATSKEDFTKIATNAQAIISSSTASESEKQEANLVYAQAVMGANDITAISVMQDLVTLLGSEVSGSSVDGTSIEGHTGNHKDKNLFNAFSGLMASASSSDMRLASIAFNSAHELSESIEVSLRKLLKEEHLIRAVCNLLTVINIVDRDFIITEDSIEPRDDAMPVADLVNRVMNPDTDPDKLLNYYSDNGIEGLTLSEALDKKQQAELKKLKVVTDRFKLLHTAVNKASGSYLNQAAGLNQGQSISVGSGLSQTVRDANILTALKDVFKGV